MAQYLLIAGAVFALNLLPAFGPPTWAVLVLFRLNSHVPAVPLILIGALSAASGRLVLATLSRHFRSRLSLKRRANLQAAGDLFTAHRGRGLAALGLFALSPVPSAQLFVGAGLMNVTLLPLTAAFFVGRLVSYSIYVSAAGVAERHFGSLLTHSLTSPLGLAAQLLMLLAIVALVRVDWTKTLNRLSRHGRGKNWPPDVPVPAGGGRAARERPAVGALPTRREHR